jgi:circadian clock protein KaiB
MPSAYKFRLFVAGNSPHSTHAIANLRELCRRHIPDCHQIEIVDVLREPKRALAEGILLTPVLVKLVPKPTVTLLGSLADFELARAALGLGVQGKSAYG